jgi:putative ABC transport system substrate-binding protein
MGQQAGKLPTIGYLSSSDLTGSLPGFRQGLSETGYVENQNVVIDARAVSGRYHELPGMAAEMASRPVTLFAAVGNANAALAAKAASATIPIVFANGGDPVKLGLVDSLNRPGGRATGVTFFNSELVGKRLELLNELVPRPAIIGWLTNPTNPNFAADSINAKTMAERMGRQLRVVNASTDDEIVEAFTTLTAERVGGLFTGADAYIASRRKLIVALATRSGIPAIYNIREFPESGGLMSYGTRLFESLRQAGIYAGRVLNGEKPGDLPVQQPSKFEFVINLTTARALRLTIPPTLLARADEVIE